MLAAVARLFQSPGIVERVKWSASPDEVRSLLAPARNEPEAPAPPTA
jgi:hypothetical protein